MSTLTEIVKEYIGNFDKQRPISYSSLQELGYEKASLSLQCDAYPEGKEGVSVRFGLFKIQKENGGKPAIFCFLAPIVSSEAEQEGVIIDKPFSFFEKLV